MIKLNFLTRKFCIKTLFCNHYGTYFSPLNTFMRKGKDPDPYLLLTDPDADPGGPKDPEHCFLRFYFGLSVSCMTYQQ
jgi:hypothetical protein